ncbi:MAG: hypothetical protein ACLFVT_03470 [Syntrophobacteria bacterium]
MKATSKKDLLTVIDRSAEELHQRIDMHRHLVASILEQRVTEGSLERLLSSCSPPDSRLKEAVKEAIEVLEESRKAFKSKRLEALRKRLTQALVESD